MAETVRTFRTDCPATDEGFLENSEIGFSEIPKPGIAHYRRHHIENSSFCKLPPISCYATGSLSCEASPYIAADPRDAKIPFFLPFSAQQVVKKLPAFWEALTRREQSS